MCDHDIEKEPHVGVGGRDNWLVGKGLTKAAVWNPTLCDNLLQACLDITVIDYDPLFLQERLQNHHPIEFLQELEEFVNMW